MHRLRTHPAPLTTLPAGLWLVCWLCCAGLPLLACGEDLLAAVVDKVKEEEEEEEIVDDDGFEIAESNFDQWVFGGAQNAAQGVSRLESQLKLRVEAIDRVCGLTDSQAAKLDLAGHGDIKRFLDDVEVVRKKFMRVRRNRKAFNKIWQDIQPLQIRMNAGLFNDASFFHKVLKRTLTDEQYSKQEQADWERRVHHYHAKLSLVVQMLERTIPLRSEQRKKLLEVLKRETQPPRSFGQYDYYVVMYQLAKLSDEKLKPILDAAQWKTLQLHTRQARGMEHWLKQQKILP